MLATQVPWFVGALALGRCAWAWWPGRGAAALAERALSLFAVGFLVVLLFTPVLYTRYCLPVLAVAVFEAAVGLGAAAAWVARGRGRRMAWGVGLAGSALAAVVAWGAYGKEYAEKWMAYRNPSRVRLVEWIRANVDASARIATDTEVWLVDPAGAKAFDLPQGVESRKRLSDFGSLAAMRAAGITHCIATTRASMKFLRIDKKTGRYQPESTMPRSDGGPGARDFFREFRREAELVLDLRGGASGYLAPRLCVFRITPPAPSEKGVEWPSLRERVGEGVQRESDLGTDDHGHE
jgi:hypothetical protein